LFWRVRVWNSANGTMPIEMCVSGSLLFSDVKNVATTVLGYTGACVLDDFFFTCELRHEFSMVLTRIRNLSFSVSFFDLLGFLVPAIFLEKHIVRRRIWHTLSSGDDPLPSNVDSRFATALCDPNLIVYSSNFSFACTYLSTSVRLEIYFVHMSI